MTSHFRILLFFVLLGIICHNSYSQINNNLDSLKQGSSVLKDSVNTENVKPDPYSRKIPLFNVSLNQLSDIIKEEISDSVKIQKLDSISRNINKHLKDGPEYLIELKQIAEEKLDSIKQLQEDSFYDMDLSEIENLNAYENESALEKELNCLVEVANSKSLSSRTTPGIITILSHDEIVQSGARDFIDLLNLVPGFYFAHDKEGKVGLGIRGNWANEGKVLLLIDGQEMNDIYTAKLYFGNHYPVDFIERIEIIRGPGSSMYGGFAEFGVINVITRSPETQKGLWVGITNGKTASMRDRRNVAIYYGKKWKKMALSVQYFTGTGQRSDQEQFAFYNSNHSGKGEYVSLKNQSNLVPNFSNISFTWGNFSLRTISDFYSVRNTTIIDTAGKHFIKSGFQNNYTEFKYKIPIGKRMSLTPKINFVAQKQIEKKHDVSTTKDYIFRPTASAVFNYDITHRLNWMMGGNFYSDFYNERDKMDTMLLDNKKIDHYYNLGFYYQLYWRLDFFNLILGGRYDQWQTAGENKKMNDPVFSPRLALTGKSGRVNYKLLYSNAFRSPTIGNLHESFTGNYSFNTDSTKIDWLERGLVNEETRVLELEIGYQLTSKTFFTANFFDITIKNPIVYAFYQDTMLVHALGFKHEPVVGRNFYMNVDKNCGSRGYELSMRFKDSWGFLDLNFSHYSVANKPKIDAYTVSSFDFNADKRILEKDDQLLAFPKNKFTAYGLFYMGDYASFAMSYILSGRNYGYAIDTLGYSARNYVTGKLVSQRPSLTTNLFFNCFPFNGLNISVGVYDLFNTRSGYFQPYFGLEPPLPGNSREWVFKISYDFGFKKNIPKEKLR